ncbi:glycosyltransferase [Arenivirga flava]|uniref:Glycosyltransferase group 1 protein n=1 Tax=Arenivirga flava TaxID=1930060 RepID=A0AA37XB44_9MICO|nr:glycosyltransferase [Arenivirga flava]GMA28066.1 glycosyltransferase group 1 protein [Arenivirga flava]
MRRERVIFVHLDYGRSEASWRERYARGEVWGETPYSYGTARTAANLKVGFSVDHKETRLGKFIRRIILFGLGFDLVHAWRNRRHFQADAIWTHTEREALAVSLILQLLRLRTVLVAQTIWLYDNGRLRNPVSRFALLLLIRRFSVELVHSDVNQSKAQELSAARRVLRIPFGPAVDEEPQLPYAPRRRSVFAPGNDKQRDWNVLIEAATLLPDVEFLIGCDPRRVKLPSSAPSNLRVKRLNRVESISNAYRTSGAVVVPLRPNAHASGATVAIEAQHFGTPLVTADTGGLKEYISEDARIFYEVGAAPSLAAAIERALDRPTVPSDLGARGLTAADYIMRYREITSWLLGDSQLNPIVEQFVRQRPDTDGDDDLPSSKKMN